jgi:3-dehydroquinate synthase
MSQGFTKICSDFESELKAVVGTQPATAVFILCDENSKQLCYPALASFDFLKGSHLITIPAGDEHKNIETAVQVWKYLSENGATRKSLLINLGGGMVTDIGGFVASSFKRGVRYINLPTTLLGAVDAATGGKTGINFLGLKNEIGVFNPASDVLINIDFFRTLDAPNLRSGYAEMVKHALIDTRNEWQEVLAFDLDTPDYEKLGVLTGRSVQIKERIVAQDPTEKNIRKALNLGHTIGHAFETFSHLTGRPALHGYAVMWGLLCELYLSHGKLNFPKDELLRLKYMTKEFYGMFAIDCADYETLYELMTHDKKNDSDEINFTLLSDVGAIHINQTATKAEIFDALDFYMMG